MNNDNYNSSTILLENVQNERVGDFEKILAMAILGFGSFLSGMLPAIVSERTSRRFPLVSSILLCLGAGVLLATALVHILPEVREQMSNNYAEIMLCVGFFFIYGVDELVHYFFGEALQHRHGSAAASTHTHDHHQHHAAALPTAPAASTSTNARNYGSLHATETSTLLRANVIRTENDSSTHHNHDHGGNVDNVQADEIQQEPDQSEPQAHDNVHCQNEAAIEEANARICHTSHTEPCEQAMTGTLGLFAALSVHSAVEGIAIGVQDSGSKVLFLLGAVSCHKFVMGFCLGLEFRSNTNTSMRSHVIGVLVFALGAVCGIGIGMAVVDIQADWMKTGLPVIQALAGGTLLYVTNIEVIPREKARWHQNVVRKSAGIMQFLAVALGFTVMCIINNFLGEDS